MAKPALLISKDLVTELKRLAVVAVKDDDSFAAAQEKFITAGNRLSSSASQFAEALYNFTWTYAASPAVIDAKMTELRISFKSTSVYHRIARLAFDDVPDKEGDAAVQKRYRYGNLIELAHKQKMPPDQFKVLVRQSISSAMRKLGAASSNGDDMLERGRLEAQKLLGEPPTPISITAPPTIGLSDGDEVELLAKLKNGQLVVYGLVPPSLSRTAALLTRFGRSLSPPERLPLFLLPDLQRALKLIAFKNAKSALATYEVDGNDMHFTVAGPGGSTILSAPAQGGFLNGQALTLPVETWGRLFTTLMPARKIIHAVSFDGKVLIAKADEEVAPNLGRWFEKAGKPITLGKPTNAELHIPLTSTTPPAARQVKDKLKWSAEVSLGTSGLAALAVFKPTTAHTALTFGATKLTLKSAAKTPANGLTVSRRQLSLLRKAVSKLLLLISAES